jgi:Domain of unknown function (DUF4129)
MNTTRLPRKTFADYAAIAVCPALIMLVVGSLIFFLLAIGYSGSHLGKLRWTFFWFTLAMVLVSRIAIEKGASYAWVYGVGLAGATAFVLLRYVAFNWWLWPLLGLIWWATNKLTWDCTVIDEDQDASGEGLLQAAKLDSYQPEPPPAPAESASLEAESYAPSSGGKHPAKPAGGGRAKAPRAAQPHAPGLWVIYFSLGALPAFGLGQGLIAKQDVATRQYAFSLLVIYLAAALGLLLITSFLGLRRYLRQRQLAMPAAMAASWLSTGTLIGSSILIACLLLPRPSAYWSVTAMIDRLGDRPVKQVHKRSAAPASLDKNSSGQGGEQGGSAGHAKGGPLNRSTDQQAKAYQKPTPGQGQSRASQPAPQLSPHSPRQLLRVALYAALAILGLFLVIKYRRELARLLREFWQALRDFWNSLFARQPKEELESEPDVQTSPRRPFAMLSNPFASGAALKMSPEELVVYSFRGLEAWAERSHFGRQTDQTPFEFADQAATQAPELEPEIEQVTRLYVQVAYAKAAVLPACRTTLEILWSKMARNPGSP